MKNSEIFIMSISHGFHFILEYGDLRINGGGSSGRLEIEDRSGRWGTICDYGFDDDAGDVACSQLGYDRSSDVYTNRKYTYIQNFIKGPITYRGTKKI